jgi:hypothetical protein
VTGWFVGYAVGVAVAGVVVILLVALIVLARNIARKAETIDGGLRSAEANTAGLWRLDKTNGTATRILEAAAAARDRLEREGGRP